MTGGSSSKTVIPPRTICAPSKANAKIAGRKTHFAWRYRILAMIAVATTKTEVSDAKSSEVKDECGSLEGTPIDAILIDRDIIDKDVSYAYAHPVPIGAEMNQSPEDNRIPLDQGNIVVVVMLPSHGYDMALNTWGWIPAGAEGISDNLGPFTSDNLEKIMPEILYGGIRLRSVS